MFTDAMSSRLVDIGLIPKDTANIQENDKDIRLVKIMQHGSWFYERGSSPNDHLLLVLEQITGKKCLTNVEAMCELENLTLGQVRSIHDLLTKTLWNLDPENIADRAVCSFGGVMWSKIYQTHDDEPWLDIENDEPVKTNDNSQNIAQMHFLPLGLNRRIPSLARQTMQLLVIDINRFVEGFSMYRPGSNEVKPNMVSFHANFDMARILNKGFKFRIANIWIDRQHISNFTSWEDLHEQPDVVAHMFATIDDIETRTWDASNELLAKTVNRDAQSSNSKYRLLELSLRKLAISVMTTDHDKIPDDKLGELWDIYRPSFLTKETKQSRGILDFLKFW